MCADVAFHDKGDGNPHAHILLTMRPLTPDGKWGDKSRLEYILDADGNRIPAKQKGRWKTRKVCTTDWDDRGNAERWRAAAAAAINEALREAGFTQGFVDPRSYADQGVQRIPSIILLYPCHPFLNVSMSCTADLLNERTNALFAFAYWMVLTE